MLSRHPRPSSVSFNAAVSACEKDVAATPSRLLQNMFFSGNPFLVGFVLKENQADNQNLGRGSLCPGWFEREPTTAGNCRFLKDVGQGFQWPTCLLPSSCTRQTDMESNKTQFEKNHSFGTPFQIPWYLLRAVKHPNMERTQKLGLVMVKGGSFVCCRLNTWEFLKIAYPLFVWLFEGSGNRRRPNTQRRTKYPKKDQIPKEGPNPKRRTKFQKKDQVPQEGPFVILCFVFFLGGILCRGSPTRPPSDFPRSAGGPVAAGLRLACGHGEVRAARGRHHLAVWPSTSGFCLGVGVGWLGVGACVLAKHQVPCQEGGLD